MGTHIQAWLRDMGAWLSIETNLIAILDIIGISPQGR